MPGAFDRAAALRRLADTHFDVLVIGGGIVGTGTAVDAASRGLRTALVERDDFASGTSSKSSKLVHGGLRYLQQGDVRLVYEALAERQRLRRNAPHLVKVLPFLLPVFGKGGVIPKKLSPRARQRHVDVRPHRRRPHRPAPQAHHRGRGPRPHADAAGRQARRVLPLLRRPGRRRPPHADPGPHRGHRLRRGGRQRHPRRRAAEGRIGPGRRRPGRGGRRPRRRDGDRRARRRGRQRGRRLERRHPLARRGPAPELPPSGQGHPHHRAVVEGAQRHRRGRPGAQGQALDLRGAVGRLHLHRHHRHRLRRAHRRPAVHARRHRLPAREP